MWTGLTILVRKHNGKTMLMDRLHNAQNFEKFQNSKIHYHSIKEHPKISKIAKFGCEML